MVVKDNIFGKGFIASNFKNLKKILKKNNIILYCAGISNSQERSKQKLNREILTLKKFFKIYKNNFIIYFSSSSILDKSRNSSPYLKNKIKIEKFIKKKFKKFTLIRLPEIIGFSDNPNTVTNFFYEKIKNNKEFKLINNTKRNLIDVDDIVKLLKIIIETKNIKKKTITICNKYYYKSNEIVKILEIICKKKANYQTITAKKQIWNLNYNIIKKYVKKAKINFDKKYLKRTLTKYYK